MPKVGMEPKRRADLVAAVIDEIGDARSLDVTVSRIAKRAGMSSGLAHHYFGSKEQMLIAAMRHILRGYSQRVARHLRGQSTPRGRLYGIIQANFEPEVFHQRTISAWLSFYALAHVNPDAARLMSIYHRRLCSNLLHELRQLTPNPIEAERILSTTIDGAYLRAALKGGAVSEEMATTVRATADALLPEQ